MTKVTIKRFGANAILIEWPQIISERIILEINYIKITIQSLNLDIVDLIIGYNSLTVTFNTYIKEIEKIKENIHEIINGIPDMVNLPYNTWEIPVCYDSSFGIDIKDLAYNKQLTVDEVINLHTTPEYIVYFIGFLPGFMYLGGLNPLLHTSRKSTPRLHVQKGSVAIGGAQTGAYPQDSAGGWNIIGNTPVSLFDLTRKEPCFAKSLDRIKFTPISLNEYNAYQTTTPKLVVND